MTTYSSREEIDEQYRWDLSSIFESDEAFLAALEEAKKLPPRFASFQGKISASAGESTCSRLLKMTSKQRRYSSSSGSCE